MPHTAEDIATAGLEQAILKRGLRRAILKDSKAWEALYHQLRDAYTRAWSVQVRAAIAEALDSLREMEPGRFTRADGETLLAALSTHVGPEAMAAALRGPVLSLSDALARLGAQEVAQAAGIDLAFMRPDPDALRMIQDANLYWVANSWNSYTDGLFRSALKDYFTAGMTREQLAARFAEDFAGAGERAAHHWELLADHTATQTRELGRVDGYLRAGAEYVVVRAHLDERTTEICRHMHGRVIAVDRLVEQRTAWANAMRLRDADAAKAAWTMHQDASAVKDIATDQLPKGTAGPPYHFHCRSITVMYFAPDNEPDIWRDKITNREPLSRAETEALIDRCKTATWDSGKSLTDHARKHASAWGGVAAYNQDAVDRIRRADRDVYLAVDGETLLALFVEPYTSTGRAQKYRVTIAAVKNRRLVTQHIRDTLDSQRYDVQPIRVPGRGIMKWRSG